MASVLAVALQVGRKAENLIVPLELLQYLGPTDFASQRDFVRWKRRQLALLEEGLIHCSGDPPPSDGVPSLLSRKSEGDMMTSRLRTLLSQMQTGEVDSHETLTKQSLRSAVLAKAEKQVRMLRDVSDQGEKCTVNIMQFP